MDSNDAGSVLYRCLGDGHEMTKQACTAEPKFRVVMLLNNALAREPFTVVRARAWAQQAIAPVLRKQAANATLHIVDLDVSLPRVSDVWIWCTKDVQAYHHLLADLRESRFWYRYCTIVETLVGVDECYAENYYRELIPAWPKPGAHNVPSGTVMRHVA